MMEGMAEKGDLSQLEVGRPRALRIWLKMPKAGLYKRLVQIRDTATMEVTTGRKYTVRKNDLKWSTLLINTAKIRPIAVLTTTTTRAK
jgi:hypothetical protein